MASGAIGVALHDTSDIFLYWSLVKLPARIAIVLLCLPYAFSLLSSASASHHRSARFGRFVWLTALATIACVGIHTSETQKLDSYAFLQLGFAITLKTLQLSPTVMLVIQNRILDLTRYVPHSTPLEKASFHMTLPPFVLHLATTLLVYAIDAISQWPKRWSTLGQHCWIWATAVLVIRGGMALVEDWDETPTTECVKDDQDAIPGDSDLQCYGILSHGSRYCVSALLAMMIVCVTSFHINIGSGSVRIPGELSQNERTALYMIAIAACWVSLSVYYLRNATEKPKRDVVDFASLNETMTSPHKGRFRWLWLLFFLSALVPLLLASGKHTLSGTTLHLIYVATGKTVSPSSRVQIHVLNSTLSIQTELSALKTFAIPEHRTLGPRYTSSSIPSVDVVIAYYNEPTQNLCRIVGRIRREVTWARVRVVLYHKGIPSFGDEEVSGDDVDGILETLKMATDADVVIPRKNLGRDMGVYLNHMQVDSIGLLCQLLTALSDIVSNTGTSWRSKLSSCKVCDLVPDASSDPDFSPSPTPRDASGVAKATALEPICRIHDVSFPRIASLNHTDSLSQPGRVPIIRRSNRSRKRLALSRNVSRVGSVLSEYIHASGPADPDHVEGGDSSLAGEDPNDET